MNDAASDIQQGFPTLALLERGISPGLVPRTRPLILNLISQDYALGGLSNEERLPGGPDVAPVT